MADEGSKTTRCTHCDSEFTDADLHEATGCPKCGTYSLPCDIAQDLTVKINWHELRIVCMWADNWAEKFLDENGQTTVRSIVRRLGKQKPDPGWPPLTFLGELMELKKEGHQVEAFDSNGNVLIKPDKKGEA